MGRGKTSLHSSIDTLLIPRDIFNHNSALEKINLKNA